MALYRAGKYLLASLEDGQRLVLHLGMTGQLFVTSGAWGQRSPSRATRATSGTQPQPSSGPDRHTHLRIEFADDGPELWFRDVRKFGRVLLLGPGEHSPRLEKLGIDALSATGSDLFAATRKRSVCIKSLLLDQSVLAGVGNIYADEALFRAGVRPARRASSLTRANCQALVDAVKRVMLDSIGQGGTTVSDYVDPDRRGGSYQRQLRVYGREGEPCRKCRTRIKRLALGQRSTHYCPQCQK